MGTGTLPQLRSAMRIILENQAHFHGCSEPPVCADVERNFRELFNPSDTAWRLQVMQEAALVFGALQEKY